MWTALFLGISFSFSNIWAPTRCVEDCRIAEANALPAAFLFGTWGTALSQVAGCPEQAEPSSVGWEQIRSLWKPSSESSQLFGPMLAYVHCFETIKHMETQASKSKTSGEIPQVGKKFYSLQTNLPFDFLKSLMGAFPYRFPEPCYGGRHIWGSSSKQIP